jgi:DNA invertase Pin-like site-specific DNA recombinase
MKVFYIRCSTVEQNEARQLAMAQEHCANRVFVDKASGKNTDRAELQKMLSFVREGDTVICESFSRIARNTRDLLSITDELQSKGVKFVSLKEAIDTSTPQGEFMLTIFAALAQMERESILQRKSEGIAIAKANGIYKGRKPMEIDKTKFTRMCKEWRNNERTATSIQKAFNITSTTFYRWVKAMGV